MADEGTLVQSRVKFNETVVASVSKGEGGIVARLRSVCVSD